MQLGRKCIQQGFIAEHVKSILLIELSHLNLQAPMRSEEETACVWGWG